jgi:hypothetical protein
VYNKRDQPFGEVAGPFVIFIMRLLGDIWDGLQKDLLAFARLLRILLFKSGYYQPDEGISGEV